MVTLVCGCPSTRRRLSEVAAGDHRRGLQRREHGHGHVQGVAVRRAAADAAAAAAQPAAARRRPCALLLEGKENARRPGVVHRWCYEIPMDDPKGCLAYYTKSASGNIRICRESSFERDGDKANYLPGMCRNDEGYGDDSHTVRAALAPPPGSPTPSPPPMPPPPSAPPRPPTTPSPPADPPSCPLRRRRPRRRPRRPGRRLRHAAVAAALPARRGAAAAAAEPTTGLAAAALAAADAAAARQPQPRRPSTRAPPADPPSCQAPPPPRQPPSPPSPPPSPPPPSPPPYPPDEAGPAAAEPTTGPTGAAAPPPMPPPPGGRPHARAPEPARGPTVAARSPAVAARAAAAATEPAAALAAALPARRGAAPTAALAAAAIALTTEPTALPSTTTNAALAAVGAVAARVAAVAARAPAPSPPRRLGRRRAASAALAAALPARRGALAAAAVASAHLAAAAQPAADAAAAAAHPSPPMDPPSPPQPPGSPRRNPAFPRTRRWRRRPGHRLLGGALRRPGRCGEHHRCGAADLSAVTTLEECSRTPRQIAPNEPNNTIDVEGDTSPPGPGVLLRRNCSIAGACQTRHHRSAPVLYHVALLARPAPRAMRRALCWATCAASVTTRPAPPPPAVPNACVGYGSRNRRAPTRSWRAHGPRTSPVPLSLCRRHERVLLHTYNPKGVPTGACVHVGNPDGGAHARRGLHRPHRPPAARRADGRVLDQRRGRGRGLLRRRRPQRLSLRRHGAAHLAAAPARRRSAPSRWPRAPARTTPRPRPSPRVRRSGSRTASLRRPTRRRRDVPEFATVGGWTWFGTLFTSQNPSARSCEDAGLTTITAGVRRRPRWPASAP